MTLVPLAQLARHGDQAKHLRASAFERARSTRPVEAPCLHHSRSMTALETEGAAPQAWVTEKGELASERPTIPVPPPRESGVRLKVTQLATFAASVDVVVCDLSRDPRSESYTPPRTPARSGLWPAQRGALATCRADQNESPPSTSTVRALK